jgi:two-component system response regulator
MILIVEDNADDSFLLTRQLARAHLTKEVQVIGDGADAWELLRTRVDSPEVVFLDLNLPRLSGIDLLRKIRADHRLQNTSVIVMTGSVDTKDVEICTELGVAAYLPKPVTLETFAKIIGYTDTDKVPSDPGIRLRDQDPAGFGRFQV